jgi:hypothetical protein
MLGILLVALLLIGQFHPGTGAEVLGWKPTRSAELQARNEIDDAEQMLAAANERRRRLGKPERTREQVELGVQATRAELARRAAQHAAARDDAERG